jgi:hypothetical protein
MTCREYTEHNHYEQCNLQNNHLGNNKSNEEGDRSTSGSMKTQISSSKSNNSTPEVCKIFNKNDSTPIENDDVFKITPHFINEKPINKNIQFVFNNNNNNKNNKKNEKKVKYARPLTPNLNILRKTSAPINQTSNANKLLSKINNDNGYLIYECKKYLNESKEKNIITESKEKTEKDIRVNINKRIKEDVIKTESNIRKYSFSCTKNIILKNSSNFNTNSSINDNNMIKNKNNHKRQPINNYINSSIGNSNSNNKIPLSFNNKKKAQSKSKMNNNHLKKEKSQKKNLSMISRRSNNTNNMNKSINNKKMVRNISKKNNNEVIMDDKLKSFKSENKINVVHSKVNNEINNLFSGLSDNIVKDPEIHNKIECLIKDIKDIQQVVHRKTQTHFRPRKQNSINKKGGIHYN